MKFKSKLAQAAYEEIIKLPRLMDPRPTPEFQAWGIARAIEVAAKIEIEERRLRFEMREAYKKS